MNSISSKANPLIKRVKKLHQKKYRKSSYLIEGWHLFEEAVAAGAEILHIFALKEYEERLQAFPQLILVSPEILADLAKSKTPQGVVAELALPEAALPQQVQGRYLFLEDVQDPGNVGTMIRTADAAGWTAVFLSENSADPYNLKTLRSMQGSHFHLPIYQVKTLELLQLAREQQLEVLASTLAADSIPYQKIKEKESFILVMGNEGQGISQLVAKEANQLVHIPMKGQAESLNVAVAAGILIFALS
ncbi:TrmH family RNA methyltransferase [Streptococcus oricebi]|uniref:23S rRNA methyltransferase n=1 Tax=Streptococcus oricebi TaxID=1547447 RepID=A0ABS5B3K3_9STRE|nr:RNA methyltransferase [Streptococcus oricebi]MBP2623416.1 23S rRNA methyltransferase [Streptococcus oricebi]